MMGVMMGCQGEACRELGGGTWWGGGGARWGSMLTVKVVASCLRFVLPKIL